ncbi:MAG TPA: hypothetical protein VGQ36_25280 [Thermoanaerobaculia bacterium]|nr:hypothetical protein [Thermoanaerobaculia bacterium]
MEQKSGSSFPKVLLIGCGVVFTGGAIFFAALAYWISSTPEGGVKLGYEMDKYALVYLDKHKILAPGEEVLAYYDVTLGMDGTEAAILTNHRVIYHKASRSTAIRLKDVRDVRHRRESLVGDVIEVEDGAGKIMKIEIAPLNQGETFKNALMSAWRAARDS